MPESSTRRGYLHIIERLKDVDRRRRLEAILAGCLDNGSRCRRADGPRARRGAGRVRRRRAGRVAHRPPGDRALRDRSCPYKHPRDVISLDRLPLTRSARCERTSPHARTRFPGRRPKSVASTRTSTETPGSCRGPCRECALGGGVTQPRRRMGGIRTCARCRSRRKSPTGRARYVALRFVRSRDDRAVVALPGWILGVAWNMFVLQL